MSKFFDPLKEEFKWNPHGWLNLIGALGSFPSIFSAYLYDSFWLGSGVLLGWYFLVYFIYLTYCYFKSKSE